MPVWLTLQAGALIAGGAILAGSGWQSRGWYEDAQRLTARAAATQAIQAAQAREATVAEQVEQRLAGLKTTERVIDRGVIREIQKPIYKRLCISDAGIRLLNAAAAGLAPSPADPADAVPEHPAQPAQRHRRRPAQNDD